MNRALPIILPRVLECFPLNTLEKRGVDCHSWEEETVNQGVWRGPSQLRLSQNRFPWNCLAHARWKASVFLKTTWATLSCSKGCLIRMAVDHLREEMMPSCLSDIINKCSFFKKFSKKLKKRVGEMLRVSIFTYFLYLLDTPWCKLSKGKQPSCFQVYQKQHQNIPNQMISLLRRKEPNSFTCTLPGPPLH